MKYHMQFSNNQNSISEIKTDRITLATPDINKASLIFDAVKASAEDIYPWLPWAKRDISLKDIENYINHFIDCNKKDNPSNLFFDIWDNESDKYLGNIYFGQIEWRAPAFSIGYWIDSRESNKGYMTEAVNALSHVAFRHFKAKRIEISTSNENVSAKRIPEKLNFDLEAEFVNHHKNYATNKISNTLVYSCIDENRLPKLKVSYYLENEIFTESIIKERNAILEKATKYFEGKDGIQAIFLQGSIPEEETDCFSDIDLRVVVEEAFFNEVIASRKNIPKKFGSWLFNEWDIDWENICVSHYLPFNKLDIVYYKISELSPSVWLAKPTSILFDPEKIISKLIVESKKIIFQPNIEKIERAISKVIGCSHEVYRRACRNELLYANKILLNLKEYIVMLIDWMNGIESIGLSHCEKRLPENMRLSFEIDTKNSANYILSDLKQTISICEIVFKKLHKKFNLNRELNKDLNSLMIVNKRS